MASGTAAAAAECEREGEARDPMAMAMEESRSIRSDPISTSSRGLPVKLVSIFSSISFFVWALGSYFVFFLHFFNDEIYILSLIYQIEWRASEC